MSPLAIVKLIHIQTNKLYSFRNLLFRWRLRHLFLFREFFQADQERLTLEPPDLLVSFHLPNKSGL